MELTSSTTINDLPSETVTHILNYAVSSPQNFAIVSLVCKLWHGIEEEMRFRHVNLRGSVGYHYYPSHWKIGKTISQSYRSEPE